MAQRHISPEECKVREAIRELDTPEGVTLREVYEDQDHSGSPALRINFAVVRANSVDRRRASKLAKYASAVRDSLLKQDGPWPYVSFVGGRAAVSGRTARKEHVTRA